MKKILPFFITAMAVFQSGNALLPPLYQTADEITFILTNSELGKHLQSGEVIMQVNNIGNGYEIVTNKNRVMVDITYKPNDRPGPARFNLKFHEVQPL